MNTQQAYNEWASTYDSVTNKTRDLELDAALHVLSGKDFSRVLEIGCGTGKNTEWISKKAMDLTAVDFSEGMLEVAQQKANTSNAKFKQADITLHWNFENATLIICSLVLEHIENIHFIFEQAAGTLEENGCIYICELHPYKQLEGSRAKFEHEGKVIELEYFIHHISDFFSAALKNNLRCIHLNEWFDNDDKKETPRLVSFVFQKKG